MGLELVEFVFGLEEVFGITIPDVEAQELDTPRRLIDYLTSRLQGAQSESESDEGWTREKVADVIHTLIWEQFGLSRDSYTEGSHWSKDMGIW